MATADVLLKVPVDRSSCAAWLKKQDPPIVADALSLCEAAFSAVRRDVSEGEVSRIEQLHALHVKQVREKFEREKSALAEEVRIAKESADSLHIAMNLEPIKLWFSSTSIEARRGFFEEMCRVSSFAEVLEDWYGSLLSSARAALQVAADTQEQARLQAEAERDVARTDLQTAVEAAARHARLQAEAERDAARADLQAAADSQQQAVDAATREARLQAEAERDVARADLQAAADSQQQAVDAATREARLQAEAERDVARADLQTAVEAAARQARLQAEAERDVARADLQTAVEAAARQARLQAEAERDAARADLQAAADSQQQAVDAATREARLQAEAERDVARADLQAAADARRQTETERDAARAALQAALSGHQQQGHIAPPTRLTTDGDYWEEKSVRFLQDIKSLVQERESIIACQIRSKCTLHVEVIPIPRPSTCSRGQFDAAYLEVKLMREDETISCVQLRVESKGGQNSRSTTSDKVVLDLHALKAENIGSCILLAYINWNQRSTEPELMKMSAAGVLVYDNAAVPSNEAAMTREVMVHVYGALLQMANSDAYSEEMQKQRDAELQFTEGLTDFTSTYIIKGVTALASHEWCTTPKRDAFWLQLLKAFNGEGLLVALKKLVTSKAKKPVWTKDFCEKLQLCFPAPRTAHPKRRVISLGGPRVKRKSVTIIDAEPQA